TGVEVTLAVRSPGQVTAGGAAVDARHHLEHLLAGGDVVDVDVALLAAALRQGHGDELAVGRGDEPVDGDVSLLVDLGGIHQGPGLVGVLGRRHHHQKTLLPGRLPLDGKELATAGDEAAVANGFGGEDLLDALADLVHPGQLVEDAAGIGILVVAPLLHGLVLAVLEPAIVVADADAVVGV